MHRTMIADGLAVTGECNFLRCICNQTDASCPSELFSKESQKLQTSATHPCRTLSQPVLLQANRYYISNHLVWPKQSISSCCLAKVQAVFLQWGRWLRKQASLERLVSPSCLTHSYILPNIWQQWVREPYFCMRQGGRLKDILRYLLVLSMTVCCLNQIVLGSHIRNALIGLCHAADDETACASWVFLHDLISTGFVFFTIIHAFYLH